AAAKYTLSTTRLAPAGAPAVSTPLASATGSFPAATPPFGVLPDIDVAFPTPAAVVAGTQYAIVVTSTSGRVAWQADLGPSQSVGCQSGVYAGGRVLFSTGPRDDSDAFFQEYVVPTFTVSLAVRGSGTVSLKPTGTACATASCTATVPAGTSLTLTARPANGYRFAGWSGGCTGTNPTCTIDVEDNVSATAVFTVLTLPLTV